MKKSIWKFQLDEFAVRPHQVSIPMPAGTEILSVQEQSDHICIWAHVDTNEASIVNREFVILGTGWSVDTAGLKYLATIVQKVFVWHVFEVVPE